MCFEEKYTYGETPTRKQIEDALDVLKAERFARWQTMMTEQEKEEIEQAHNLCIFLLSEAKKKKEGVSTPSKVSTPSS